MADIEFGKVPPMIAAVSRVLESKASEWLQRLGSEAIPEEAGDHQDLLVRLVKESHRAVQASTDLRSMWTAYAHHFHEPRPVVTRLADAQNSTRQGVVRRYNESMVVAIEQLLSDEPDVELIRAGIHSLTIPDMENLPGPVGQAARQMRRVGRARAGE